MKVMIREAKALLVLRIHMQQLLMDGVLLFSAQQQLILLFLLIMGRTHNGRLVDIIPSLHTAVLLCTVFIFLYVSQQRDTHSPNTKTEWHYLLAVVICIFIPSFSNSDSTKRARAHTQIQMHVRAHTHDHFLFHTSKYEALAGLSTLANMALLFLGRQPSEPVLTAPLLIFIFHRILITLCFIFHVSRLLACPWPCAVVLLYNAALKYWLFSRGHALLWLFPSGR